MSITCPFGARIKRVFFVGCRTQFSTPQNANLIDYRNHEFSLKRMMPTCRQRYSAGCLAAQLKRGSCLHYLGYSTSQALVLEHRDMVCVLQCSFCNVGYTFRPISGPLYMSGLSEGQRWVTFSLNVHNLSVWSPNQARFFCRMQNTV